jgi:hypothetical protein
MIEKINKNEKKNKNKTRTSVKLHGKEILIKKAYKKPNFNHKTVLTNDSWRYVDIYLKGLRKDEADKARKYWEQARQFYIASKQLTENASPLTLYYSFLNATKALLYSKENQFNDTYHGLKNPDNNKSTSIYGEKIKLCKDGVFPGLCNYFDEDSCENVEYSLKWVLYNIPYIHRAFSLTYKGSSDLFIPIRNPRFVYDSRTRDIWFEAELEENNSNINTLKMIKNFELDEFYHKNNYIIKSIEHLHNNPSYSIRETDLDRFLIFYRKIRKTVDYIHGSRDLWYIKRGHISNSINRTTMTMTLAAMHNLSSLARYHPDRLEKYLSKNSHWLLSEFINISPGQFIDEIACEITGCNLQNPGIKIE